MVPTLSDIQAAQEELHGHVVRTPLVLLADPFSQLSSVHLKLENFQATGSFKDRGAYLKLKSLSAEQQKTGVVAMSAGNHAQGIAYHAQQLGIPATIIMPINAPLTKVTRTRAFGANVILEGETLDEAKETVGRLIEEQGLTLVHPFNDFEVMRGQGTVGLEILEDLPDVERIIVPIGGGGLISGIAIAAKSTNPAIEIVGVEVESYASMHTRLAKTEAVQGGATIADGIAVKAPGDLTAKVVEQHVDRLIKVTEQDIESGVFKLLESANVVAEGAGAAGMAAVLASKSLQDGKKTAIVVCGGNIDLNILSNIIRRGLLNEQRVVKLRVLIDDRPGVLSKITNAIGAKNGNILDVAHHRTSCSHTAKNANLDLIIEIALPEVAQQIKEEIQSLGFQVTKI